MRLFVLLASLLGVLPFLSPSVRADTLFHYTSESGDYIGGGQERTITPAGGFTFSVTGDTNHVRFYITSASSSSNFQFYSVDLAAPEGKTLAVGDYPFATRYPFQESDHPGLDFSANGAGSNESTGQFQVLEISFDASGSLATFAANFVHHSEGGDPASYGQVRFNSSVPYLTPAGVAQLGNNHYKAFSRDGSLVVKVTRRGGGTGPLSVDYSTADGTDLAGRDYTATSGTITWADGDISDRTFAVPILNSGNPFQGNGNFYVQLTGPSTGAQTLATVSLVNNNSSVTFLHFESDPGDYIGAGQEKLLSIANGCVITAAANNGGVRFSIDNNNYTSYELEEDWDLELSAAVGSIFGLGDYEDAQRDPFKESGHPGLEFSGDGRGSNTLTGNFQVLELAYDNEGNILRFAANFEQHSEGGKPALYGQIRYNSAVPLPPPRPVQVVAAATNSYTSESSSYPGSPAVITFTRSGGTADKLKVFYKLVGNAVNGYDYQELTGVVKFKAGKSTAQIKIVPRHTGVASTVKLKLKILPQDGQYEVGDFKAPKISINHSPF